MDNQHKKIKGYRDLSQLEIDLMNEIKGKAEETGNLVVALQQLRKRQTEGNSFIEITTEQLLESQRNTAIAKTHLQTGFMWLVRAVALPSSF